MHYFVLNRTEGNSTDKSADIKVVDIMKYLCVQITNKRNYFTKYKHRKIDYGRKMANVAYSVKTMHVLRY